MEGGRSQYAWFFVVVGLMTLIDRGHMFRDDYGAPLSKVHSHTLATAGRSWVAYNEPEFCWA